MSTQGIMFNPYQYGCPSYYDSYSTMADLPGMSDYNYSLDGMMPFGYNMMPFGGYNYQQYYDNMSQMQDFYSQYNRHNVELQRGNDITINSPDVAINKAHGALIGKIVGNEQEQISLALIKFENAVRKKYPNATDEQVKDYLAYEYSLRSGGSTLTEDIKKYGSGSFLQGLKQGLGLGLIADNKTADENCAAIEDLPESRTSKMKKHIGRVTGSTASCAAVGATIGACCGGPAGAGVGLVIGAIVGLVGGIGVSASKG